MAKIKTRKRKTYKGGSKKERRETLRKEIAKQEKLLERLRQELDAISESDNEVIDLTEDDTPREPPIREPAIREPAIRQQPRQEAEEKQAENQAADAPSSRDSFIYRIPTMASRLRNIDIQFYFYSKSKDAKPGKGEREKLPEGMESKFEELSRIKDWRKHLSNFGIAVFELDGLRWNSVEHYYQGAKFKKNNPDFYKQFSLDSHSDFSTDPNKAKSAGGKSGGQFRPKHIKIDPDFFGGREKLEMYKAQKAKFTQSEEMKKTLRLTKDATLMHIVPRSSNAVEFYNLEYLRSKL
jgi:predicted NAD-dependent protein-ADP-ribosyltransferase YbiA (DUF1768 family)